MCNDFDDAHQCGHMKPQGWETHGYEAKPSPLSLVIKEMNEALQSGAFFNPEMFGSMLKGSDNPILRWRDELLKVASQPSAEPPQTVKAAIESLKRFIDGMVSGSTEHGAFGRGFRGEYVPHPLMALQTIESALKASPAPPAAARHEDEL
jgi:hypothetical protein